VFSRCDCFSGTTRRHLLDHLDTTIDASLISFFHFLFEPSRDAPTVFISPLDCNANAAHKATERAGATEAGGVGTSPYYPATSGFLSTLMVTYDIPKLYHVFLRNQVFNLIIVDGHIGDGFENFV